MKALLTIVRWIVGLLFIFSGLIKANDPLGLSYKMQEFFEVWGWSAFHHYTLFLSITMNIFEVLAGVAIIVGWRTRLFTWLLLLLIIFFTFLTGYAFLSGRFKSCGCFGDCLPLKPFESFLKDLLLLVLILFLFFKQKVSQSSFPASASVSVLLLTVVATGALQWYALQYLPIVDCLPYKKGNNLLKQMEMPAGAVTDSFAITFKYKKEGKIVEFDANNMPADMDASYEYVDRYDKLVRKGNATPPIEDFKLINLGGADTTDAILHQPGAYVMVLVQSFDHWQQSAADFDQVLTEARTRNMPVVVATPMPTEATKLMDTAKVTVVSCDATVVKTAARVVPTFFVMHGADIMEKKSFRNSKDILDAMSKQRP